MQSTVPKFGLEQMGTKENSHGMDNGKTVAPFPKRPKINLKDLLAGITPENRHEEVSWGKPEGREIW